MDLTLKAQIHDQVRSANRKGTNPKLGVGVVKAIRVEIGLVGGTNTIARTIEYLIEGPPPDDRSQQMRRNWIMEEYIIENLSGS